MLRNGGLIENRDKLIRSMLTDLFSLRIMVLYNGVHYVAPGVVKEVDYIHYLLLLLLPDHILERFLRANVDDSTTDIQTAVDNYQDTDVDSNDDGDYYCMDEDEEAGIDWQNEETRDIKNAVIDELYERDRIYYGVLNKTQLKQQPTRNHLNHYLFETNENLLNVK